MDIEIKDKNKKRTSRLSRYIRYTAYTLIFLIAVYSYMVYEGYQLIKGGEVIIDSTPEYKYVNQDPVLLEKEKKAVHSYNAATLFTKLSNYEDAIKKFKEAITLNTEAKGNPQLTINSILNIGNSYRLTKKYDESLKTLSQGLEEARKTNDTYHLICIHHCLGMLYKDMGNIVLAEKHLTKARVLSNSIPDNNEKAHKKTDSRDKKITPGYVIPAT